MEVCGPLSDDVACGADTVCTWRPELGDCGSSRLCHDGYSIWLSLRSCDGPHWYTPNDDRQFAWHHRTALKSCLPPIKSRECVQSLHCRDPEKPFRTSNVCRSAEEARRVSAYQFPQWSGIRQVDRVLKRSAIGNEIIRPATPPR
jgi:hypothetical protein